MSHSTPSSSPEKPKPVEMYCAKCGELYSSGWVQRKFCYFCYDSGATMIARKPEESDLEFRMKVATAKARYVRTAHTYKLTFVPGG